MIINKILIKPVLTEKATNLAKNKVYAFEVHKKATKYMVKDALEKLYEIKISNVTVQVRKGKIRKVGKKSVPKKQENRKIAYVKVREGKIDLFPQA